MSELLTLSSRRNAPAAPAGTGFAHPVLALGFRPFFLLAGIFAATIVPLWLVVFSGWLSLPISRLPMAWHGHEMVFGFAVSVVAGFLLTAVRNWTSVPTPSGARLAGLVLVWLLGRVAMALEGWLPGWLVAAVDLAFLPLLALAIAVPIVTSRNWRNLGFVPLLLLLTAANALFHFGALATSLAANRLGVGVIVLIIVVMGGRVIPMFTTNALSLPVTRHKSLDWAAFVTTFLAVACEVAPVGKTVAGWLALGAGLLNGARMLGWQSWPTRKVPLLWVLHIGYGWVALGLVLRGLTAFVPTWMASASLHGLGAGAIGILCLGMIARVSLGHTGRMLVASPTMTVAFALAAVAAAVRVLVPLFAPRVYVVGLWVSAACWSVAFALFVVQYARVLTTPRTDGKPG